VRRGQPPFVTVRRDPHPAGGGGTLRLVADPTRLQLLSMINGSPSQEVTVGELTQYLGLHQPTISHDLRRMHDDGLLDR
jgi:ArsR family transcriptional regulator